MKYIERTNLFYKINVKVKSLYKKACKKMKKMFLFAFKKKLIFLLENQNFSLLIYFVETSDDSWYFLNFSNSFIELYVKYYK